MGLVPVQPLADVHQLPPYSRVSHRAAVAAHGRTGTHNRYFASEADLLAT